MSVEHELLGRSLLVSPTRLLPLRVSRIVLGASSLVMMLGCTNGFNSFDFGEPRDAGTSSGGTGGTGGTGGNDATGGAAGTGGGSGGMNACPPGEQSCGGSCVAFDDRRNCGACGNDCTQQGFGAGFVCESGHCVCGLSPRCGDTEAVCTSNLGPCACGGADCRPGEACVDRGGAIECSCNGGSACGSGETCCQTPDGCRDLDADDENCGRCGNACSAGRNCVDGACQ